MFDFPENEDSFVDGIDLSEIAGVATAHYLCPGSEIPPVPRVCGGSIAVVDVFDRIEHREWFLLERSFIDMAGPIWINGGKIMAATGQTLRTYLADAEVDWKHHDTIELEDWGWNGVADLDGDDGYVIAHMVKRPSTHRELVHYGRPTSHNQILLPLLGLKRPNAVVDFD